MRGSMKILALDSSGLVASAAVVQDGVLIAEYTVNYKITHSQTLLPMLQELKRMVELDLDTVDAIALAAGPGSFTGLRIGSATAKGLGLALHKPLIEVSTLAGLAYHFWGSEKRICPIMDARRSQVYTGIYTFERQEGKSGFGMHTLREPRAIDIREILKELNEQGQEVIFVGDGIPVFQAVIEENLRVPFAFAPAHLNRQRAAAVAALAAVYYEEGRLVSAKEHKPEYLRLSQAERERLSHEV